MNTAVVITAEEFKTIHNTLWEMQHRGMSGEEGAERIREALKDAYRQDNEAFDRKWDHYRTVQEAQGFDTIWSLYEVEDLNGEHGFPADSFVVYSEHWGGETQHCAVYGRTWVDLWRAADQCIRNSGDTHHRFIEIFTLKNGNELHLSTGS